MVVTYNKVKKVKLYEMALQELTEDIECYFKLEVNREKWKIEVIS